VSRGYADLANERSAAPKRKPPSTPKTPEQILALGQFFPQKIKTPFFCPPRKIDFLFDFSSEILFANSPEITREKALEVSTEIDLPAQKIIWWYVMLADLFA
jgi:hypothetical protein